MPRRQPLANVRRHQKRLLAITRDEALTHRRIVLNPPDATPTYAIISSGPSLLADRAQLDLGINVIRSNEIEVRDGRLTGRFNIQVPDAKKGRVAIEVMNLLDVPPSRVASVGDAEADAAVGELVQLPIAYDSQSPALDAVARISLRHGELERLVDILLG